MEKMRCILMTQNGLSLARRPKPKPGNGEVLIKIEWASLCGSDYPFLNGSKDKSHLIGHVFGHEGAGVIIELGPNVKSLHVGDTVGIESHRAREEWLAEGGDPYKDPLSAIIGHRAFPDGRIPQGVFAEFISVPEFYANKIPKQLYRVYPGSLWEPLGNSIRLASIIREKIKIKPKRIVVSGCGPQGIMIMLILRYYLGYDAIYATDISEERLKLVAQLGVAKPYLPSELPKLSVQLWLEMSGALPAFWQAIDLVDKGGFLVLFGLPNRDEIKIGGLPYSEFVLQSQETEMQGKTLIGVCGRLKQDWEEAPMVVEALKQHIKLDSLFSYFGPLENMLPLVKYGILPPKGGTLLKGVFSGFVL